MQIYLNQVRTEKNLTIIELERLSGVSRAHISYIESGLKNPSIKILCQLAKALQVPITDLFDCND